jgi:hypothetical protein
MRNVEFVIDTPDGEVTIQAAGHAAAYLLSHGFSKADREPHWHMRWCLERMTPGESMDVGVARVLCKAQC